MTNNRRKFINDSAQELINALNASLPIDIDFVTNSLGGTLNRISNIHEGAMKDGRLEVKGDSFEITLNNYENTPERLRFSFAHELGHLFLHMGTSSVTNSVYYRYGRGIEEEEANEFAAAFLMPENIFRKIAEQSKNNDVYYISPIANFFQVSKEAVINRGKNLDIWS